MKKYLLYMIFSLILFITYSCGGSSGTSSLINIESDNVSDFVVSKSHPVNITFAWKVNCPIATEKYYMDIYVSQSNTLDSSSILIANKVCSSATDNITITPSSLGYKKLLSLYGGVYHIVFDAYVYDESGNKIEDIKSISDFAIKNIWTVMVYMDGDNSLSAATVGDLDEMKSVGSNSNVGVVVEDDTSTQTTKRYFVKQGSLVLLSDLGELNMGDYNTLIEFGKWTIENYPADHYMLILWDHGMGFENVSSLSPTKDILWDNHPLYGYSMSIPDLSKALSAIKEQLGKNIDIVGMDACLMNMLEVAYEIKDSADYLVASENTEPYDGWPYSSVIGNLEDNATEITPKYLSTLIVQNYIDSYDASYYPTLSSVDLKETGNLANAVNTLAFSLIESIDNDSTGTIKYTLNNVIFDDVQRFDDSGDGVLNTNDSYVDLYDLVQLIYNNDNMTTQIKTAAENVANACSKCVVSTAYKNSALKDSHGLSIWFPDYTIYSVFANHYSLLKFAKDTKWYEFLNLLTY